MFIDIHGNIVDSIWAAEFRGFFFGEGYVGITTSGLVRGIYPAYMARIQITLRDDDVSILENIKEKFGGDLYRSLQGRKINGEDRIHQTKPIAIWRVRKSAEIYRILDVLEDGYMPSVKRSQITILRKFLSTMKECQRGPKSPAQKLKFDNTIEERKALHIEMKNAHRYVSVIGKTGA